MPTFFIIEYSIVMNTSGYVLNPKGYKLTLLNPQTLGIAKENSVVIMKTDRSSTTELNMPYSFSIAGIAKKHDFLGSDQFLLFGKNSTDNALLKIANAISTETYRYEFLKKSNIKIALITIIVLNNNKLLYQFILISIGYFLELII